MPRTFDALLRTYVLMSYPELYYKTMFFPREDFDIQAHIPRKLREVILHVILCVPNPNKCVRIIDQSFE